MKKLSDWIKQITVNDSIGKKTHKTLNNSSIFKDDTKLLATNGCGTICVTLKTHKPFNLDLIATNALLRMTVSQLGLKLYCVYRGRFILLKEDTTEGIGLETDLECAYWISFSANSRTVLFGKHNPDADHIDFTFTLPKSNKSTKQFWMNKIAHYRIDTPAVIHLSKDLVKNDTPKIVGINLLTVRP